MQKTRTGRAQRDPTLVLPRAHATRRRLKGIAILVSFLSLYFNEHINI